MIINSAVRPQVLTPAGLDLHPQITLSTNQPETKFSTKFVDKAPLKSITNLLWILSNLNPINPLDFLAYKPSSVYLYSNLKSHYCDSITIRIWALSHIFCAFCILLIWPKYMTNIFAYEYIILAALRSIEECVYPWSSLLLYKLCHIRFH